MLLVPFGGVSVDHGNLNYPSKLRSNRCLIGPLNKPGYFWWGWGSGLMGVAEGHDIIQVSLPNLTWHLSIHPSKPAFRRVSCCLPQVYIAPWLYFGSDIQLDLGQTCGDCRGSFGDCFGYKTYEQNPVGKNICWKFWCLNLFETVPFWISFLHVFIGYSMIESNVLMQSFFMLKHSVGQIIATSHEFWGPPKIQKVAEKDNQSPCFTEI